MTTELQTLSGQLEERRKRLKTVFDQAGPDTDLKLVEDGVFVAAKDDTAARVAEIKAWNDELNDLVEKMAPLQEVEAIKRRTEELGRLNPHPGHFGGGDDDWKKGRNGGQETKSLGEMFAGSEGVKAWRDGRPGQSASVESAEFSSLLQAMGVKATFTTSGSTLGNISVQDLPGIQLLGQQRLTVADLLASGETTRETIRYVVEDTFTNAATVVAEGAAKPEASWDTSLKTDNVTKIAVLSRVSDELFADFPMLRDYIDGRMRFMVAAKEEAELVSGDGTGAHLDGITHRSGIQTQAKGVDPTPDAIYKAMNLIRTGPFVEPDGVVMHPLDWIDIRLLRTDDGVYVWGNPMDAGPERIWGLPVVVTTAITQNTGLVGAFKVGGQVWRRQGVTVDATNSNEDDFKNNLIMLRAEERLALSIYLPSAFCKVTGV